MSNKVLLSNFDIIDICKYLQLDLIAVVNKDKLSDHKSKDGAYAINLQDSTEGGGTHWVMLYLYDGQALYYDSFGEEPPSDVKHFARTYYDFVTSHDHIQDIADYSCGYYVIAMIYFCKFNKTKISLEDIMIKFNAPFNLDYPKKNVKILQHFFKKFISN